MGKKIIHLSPLLFIILLGLVLSPLRITGQIVLGTTEGIRIGTAWAQTAEGETQESHYSQLMKQLRLTVDDWLKDLNQKIESKDVTRFEVRFLEVLRSILEWVGEKIDSQIESEQKKPKKKIKGEEV